MDQKKQFFLLIGALVIIIVLIILVPGPNFGQISLVSNNGQPIAENVLKDPTLALVSTEWERSTSDFQNTVGADGVHSLSTSSTGLILTQNIDAALLRGKSSVTIAGTLQSENERDTFFMALKDSEGREIYRTSINPQQPFSVRKDLSVTEKTFAEKGLTLSIELPGNAVYKADTVSVSVQ